MLSRQDFLRLLERHGPMVIDGALATELESRGYDLNHSLWSAKILEEDPMVIKQVHLDYFLAGANFAITASYQASAAGFAEHLNLNEEKATALIKRSAMLARLAVEEAYGQTVRRDVPLLVAGSVGPYGAYLADGSEYRGDYQLSKSGFQNFHRARIRALVDAEVDLLAIETMPQVHEIEAVLELLRDEFSTTTAWVSCTLKDSQHISDGTSLVELAKLLQAHRERVLAFGFNCISADLATDALQHLTGQLDVPLLVYPNSGEKWDAQTNTWSSSSSGPLDFGQLARHWQQHGAGLIGGCCRTTPTDIIAISQALKR
ncbi:homocysteine S-methyltransferase [Neohortaea acidophila]|uniref:Homocysteine S-methyltransferase n=1 Tax=Neohortaea acidophila TaxID=245834 RepID=A0A6A6PYK7_9PEZI|nr:homocysteine S-methyltransferase [Neohortaea acidophila]KAF2484307.1 homocysteine S-methyltransferase [Neohortaea acidophila]